MVQMGLMPGVMAAQTPTNEAPESDGSDGSWEASRPGQRRGGWKEVPGSPVAYGYALLA